MLRFFCVMIFRQALSLAFVQQFESNRHVLRIVVSRLATCDTHILVHGDC